MPRAKTKLREKAFAMRVERKSFADIARELGIASRTVSRWENGYTDSYGHRHAGWKPRLETEWKKLTEAKLQHDLMQMEECLKAIERMSLMIYNRLKDFLPTVKLKNAADAKALLSEFRELIRLAALKKGEFMKSPDNLVAVRADITLSELQERYAEVKAREAEFRTVQEGEADDGSDGEKGSGAGGSTGLAEDD